MIAGYSHGDARGTITRFPGFDFKGPAYSSIFSNRLIARSGKPASVEITDLSGISVFLRINERWPIMQCSPIVTPGLM